MKKEARKITEGARYASERDGFRKSISNNTTIKPALESLNDIGDKPKIGKKLIKAGTAIILFPDPFSDLPGSIVLASGLALSKYGDPVGIKDIKTNLKNTLRFIDSLRE